jgi:hypothetical protein
MKLKFVPNFISQNKSHKIFCKENFSKPVENKQFSVLLLSIKGAFYKVFAPWGKTNDQAIVLKKYEELGPNRSKNNFFIE